MASTRHDEINLARLLRRLEKRAFEATYASPISANSSPSKGTAGQGEEWLQAIDFIQKVKYARTLLKNIELDSPDGGAQFRASFERLDSVIANVQERVVPQARLPEPLLPSIPIPAPSAPTPTARPSKENVSPDEPLPVQEFTAPLLSAPVDDLIPSTPTMSINSSARSGALASTTALQDELSDQLAAMAVQLRRNATHFASSLEKDAAVVATAGDQLEQNYDTAKRERIRLRDHRGKSGMTTCWYIWVVLGVTLAFMAMVGLIRLS
ncbi:hypothetical protein CYLTODRAFT_452523 [Cylindrobasidium torrendii FP15055 ss-10]|uniref:Uncharacterized protein n=1 Tax=Cylindrobasidium torrendii FP15055 ss-10 TaxID=1314674 RepID=A0A0D7BIR2_9AGAR|nr:hypothetical protein CYLTODRAFT_452523 [Cylindrobasidium torrendii FP15055 ss-10]